MAYESFDALVEKAERHAAEGALGAAIAAYEQARILDPARPLILDLARLYVRSHQPEKAAEVVLKMVFTSAVIEAARTFCAFTVIQDAVEGAAPGISGGQKFEVPESMREYVVWTAADYARYMRPAAVIMASVGALAPVADPYHNPTIGYTCAMLSHLSTQYAFQFLTEAETREITQKYEQYDLFDPDDECSRECDELESRKFWEWVAVLDARAAECGFDWDTWCAEGERRGQGDADTLCYLTEQAANNEGIWLYVGREAEGRGESERAAKAYSSVSEESPFHVAAMVDLAVLYDRLERTADAVRLCEGLLVKYPTSRRVLLTCAVLQQKLATARCREFANLGADGEAVRDVMEHGESALRELQSSAVQYGFSKERRTPVVPGSEHFERFVAQLFQNMQNTLLQQLRPTAPGSAGALVAQEVEEIIRSGESDRVEFKETLAIELRERGTGAYAGGRSSALQSVAESVAAFLNTRGGNLVIGVANDGSVVGLERDFGQCRKGQDGFERKLRDYCRTHLGAYPLDRVQTRFVEVDGRVVCWLSVGRASEPVYYDQKLTFVRDGNGNARLEGSAFERWLRERQGAS